MGAENRTQKRTVMYYILRRSQKDGGHLTGREEGRETKVVGTGIGARQEAMRGRTAGVMTNTVGSPARMGRETTPPLM